MGDEERDDIVDEEEGGGAEGGEAPGIGKSRIVKILLYVAGGLLAVVLMIGISYIVASKVKEPSDYERGQQAVSPPPPPPLATYELPTFSNTTADAEPHFIKMTISLGYEANVELNAELVSRKDEMQHIINILLQGKKFEDLKSVTGSVALAEEIKAHINVRLAKGKVKEVYFKELLVN